MRISKLASASRGPSPQRRVDRSGDRLVRTDLGNDRFTVRGLTVADLEEFFGELRLPPGIPIRVSVSKLPASSAPEQIHWRLDPAWLNPEGKTLADTIREDAGPVNAIKVDESFSLKQENLEGVRCVMARPGPEGYRLTRIDFQEGRPSVTAYSRGKLSQKQLANFARVALCDPFQTFPGLPDRLIDPYREIFVLDELGWEWDSRTGQVMRPAKGGYQYRTGMAMARTDQLNKYKTAAYVLRHEAAGHGGDAIHRRLTGRFLSTHPLFARPGHVTLDGNGRVDQSRSQCVSRNAAKIRRERLADSTPYLLAAREAYNEERPGQNLLGFPRKKFKKKLKERELPFEIIKQMNLIRESFYIPTAQHVDGIPPGWLVCAGSQWPD